jgi:hypothetical protein
LSAGGHRRRQAERTVQEATPRGGWHVSVSCRVEIVVGRLPF